MSLITIKEWSVPDL